MNRSRILAGAGMADLCHTLQPRLGVPVIDGVGAAVHRSCGPVFNALKRRAARQSKTGTTPSFKLPRATS